MRDLKYQQLKGAINVLKARVVYADGALHVWARDGSYREYPSTEPVHTARKTMTATAAGGPLTLRACCGCGMPIRIRMRRSAKNLMATQRK